MLYSPFISDYCYIRMLRVSLHTPLYTCIQGREHYSCFMQSGISSIRTPSWNERFLEKRFKENKTTTALIENIQWKTKLTEIHTHILKFLDYCRMFPFVVKLHHRTCTNHPLQQIVRLQHQFQKTECLFVKSD